MLLKQAGKEEVEIDVLPESLSDGDTIIYVYGIDETKTRKISATVEYRLGNEIVDTVLFEETVSFASDEYMVRLSGDFDREYSGYKSEGIYVGNEKVEQMPESVHNGICVVFQYLLDEGQTKELTASLEFWHGGNKAASGSLTSTVHVLHDDMIGTGKVDVSAYETDGWKFESVLVTNADGSNAEYAELLEAVPDGSVVAIRYAKAEIKITVKYMDADGNDK